MSIPSCVIRVEDFQSPGKRVLRTLIIVLANLTKEELFLKIAGLLNSIENSLSIPKELIEIISIMSLLSVGLFSVSCLLRIKKV